MAELDCIVILGACTAIGEALALNFAEIQNRDRQFVLVDPNRRNLSYLTNRCNGRIMKLTKNKLVDTERDPKLARQKEAQKRRRTIYPKDRQSIAARKSRRTTAVSSTGVGSSMNFDSMNLDSMLEAARRGEAERARDGGSSTIGSPRLLDEDSSSMIDEQSFFRPQQSPAGNVKFAGYAERKGTTAFKEDATITAGGKSYEEWNADDMRQMFHGNDRSDRQSNILASDRSVEQTVPTGISFMSGVSGLSSGDQELSSKRTRSSSVYSSIKTSSKKKVLRKSSSFDNFDKLDNLNKEQQSKDLVEKEKGLDNKSVKKSTRSKKKMKRKSIGFKEVSSDWDSTSDTGNDNDKKSVLKKKKFRKKSLDQSSDESSSWKLQRLSIQDADVEKRIGMKDFGNWPSDSDLQDHLGGSKDGVKDAGQEYKKELIRRLSRRVPFQSDEDDIGMADGIGDGIRESVGGTRDNIGADRSHIPPTVSPTEGRHTESSPTASRRESSPTASRREEETDQRSKDTAGHRSIIVDSSEEEGGGIAEVDRGGSGGDFSSSSNESDENSVEDDEGNDEINEEWHTYQESEDSSKRSSEYNNSNQTSHDPEEHKKTIRDLTVYNFALEEDEIPSSPKIKVQKVRRFKRKTGRRYFKEKGLPTLEEGNEEDLEGNEEDFEGNEEDLGNDDVEEQDSVCRFNLRSLYVQGKTFAKSKEGVHTDPVIDVGERPRPRLSPERTTRPTGKKETDSFLGPNKTHERGGMQKFGTTTSGYSEGKENSPREKSKEGIFQTGDAADITKSTSTTNTKKSTPTNNNIKPSPTDSSGNVETSSSEEAYARALMATKGKSNIPVGRPMDKTRRRKKMERDFDLLYWPDGTIRNPDGSMRNRYGVNLDGLGQGRNIRYDGNMGERDAAKSGTNRQMTSAANEDRRHIANSKFAIFAAKSGNSDKNRRPTKLDKNRNAKIPDKNLNAAKAAVVNRDHNLKEGDHNLNEETENEPGGNTGDPRFNYKYRHWSDERNGPKVRERDSLKNHQNHLEATITDPQDLYLYKCKRKEFAYSGLNQAIIRSAEKNKWEGCDRKWHTAGIIPGMTEGMHTVEMEGSHSDGSTMFDDDLFISYPSQFYYEVCDFASMKDVLRFTEEFTARYKKVHVVLNCLDRLCATKMCTKEGFERSCQVNYIAPSLIFREFLKLANLQKKDCCRFITFSIAYENEPVDERQVDLTKNLEQFEAESDTFKNMNAVTEYSREVFYAQSKATIKKVHNIR